MDKIVLDRFMKIGDRVTMMMDEEARSWGRKGPPDGTQGTVVGFHRYTAWVPRVGGWNEKPGKYLCNGATFVAWDNGFNDTVSAHDVVWSVEHEKTKQERMSDKAYIEAFEKRSWVEDLPDLPIWEDDVVDVVSRRWDGEKQMRVKRIDYYNLGEKRNDGVTPMPIYACTGLDGTGGEVSLDETEVKFASRGRVWKWMNGQDDMVSFKDLQDEAAFHRWLGLVKQVKNPTSGDYGWTLPQILTAMAEETVDAFTINNGFPFLATMFSKPKRQNPEDSSHSAWKFDSANLGERTRKAALGAFNESAVQELIRASECED